MTIEILRPAVLWGLLAIALPIVIHLLARHRAERLRFPSLRFLPASRTAALRARVVSHWPLLLVRVAIAALAVAAMSAPVFVSDARRAAWQQRVARAIVVEDAARADAVALISEASAGSFVSETFRAAHVADALREAEWWLAGQPPSAREVIVIGRLRQEAIGAHDIARLPAHVGLRFLPLTPDRSNREVVVARSVTDVGEGRAEPFEVRITPRLRDTLVSYRPAADPEHPLVVVEAPPAHAAAAAALVRAVWRAGVFLGRESNRAVVVAFPGAAAPSGEPRVPDVAWMREALGAAPGVRGGQVGDALRLEIPVPPTHPEAPDLVAPALRAAFSDSLNEVEPARIPAQQLHEWERPHGGVPSDAPLLDEGDRRWLWVAVLFLLALEQLLRRGSEVARA